MKALFSTLKQITLYFIVGFLLSSLTYVLIYRYIPISHSPLMVYNSLSRTSPSGIKGIQFISSYEIPEHMKLAVICSEDQNFYAHSGFDLAAIEQALEEYDQKGRLRGASTISQQCAKNLFLLPVRSFIRKGLEAYFTVLIEFFWTKDRIISVYLNIIEFGTGVYGVEQASETFFQKKASALSKEEAALLAAVLPNPHRFKVSQPTPYVLKRQQWIRKQMQNYNDQLPQ